MIVVGTVSSKQEARELQYVTAVLKVSDLARTLAKQTKEE